MYVAYSSLLRYGMQIRQWISLWNQRWYEDVVFLVASKLHYWSYRDLETHFTHIADSAGPTLMDINEVSRLDFHSSDRIFLGIILLVLLYRSKVSRTHPVPCHSVDFIKTSTRLFDPKSSIGRPFNNSLTFACPWSIITHGQCIQPVPLLLFTPTDFQNQLPHKKRPNRSLITNLMKNGFGCAACCLPQNQHTLPRASIIQCPCIVVHIECDTHLLLSHRQRSHIQQPPST